MTESSSRSNPDIALRGWEANVFVLESIVAGGFVSALAIGGLRSLLEGVAASMALAFGIGFFLLYWIIYPGLNVLARAKRGTGIPALKSLGWSVAGAIVGGITYAIFAA